MIALSICVIDMPGLCASRNAWSMVWPVTRPLPALAGTVPGMVQLPPPVLLRVALVLCVAERFGLV